MAKTIVGLYDDLGDARRVVEELIDAGFDRDRVSLVAHAGAEEYRRYFDDEGRYVEETDRTYRDDEMTAGEGAAAGAGIGAAIGAIGGLVMGLGLVAVPGVGPALAAGPIVSTLVGAGIGGVAGGLLGALVNAGVPEERAHYYSEGVRRGGSLVMVHAEDALAERAVDIMDRYNAVDIEERATYWRQEGWTRFDENAEPYTADQIAEERRRYGYGTTTAATTTATMDRDTRTADRTAVTTDRDTARAQEGDTLEVVEEDVRVGKREVERGGVRIHSYVTEEPVEKDVHLRDEKVHVDRHKVDRPVSGADRDAFRERTMEVTEHHEEPVVDKQARVVEEVTVGKEVRDRTETVRDTVRRTDVEIQEVGVDRNRDTDYGRYREEYRRHFDQAPLRERYSYVEVEPAYRYGYYLANEDRYRDRDWREIEPEARTEWETRNQGTWDDFRDSIRYSWERART